jgi:hypothetical protein
MKDPDWFQPDIENPDLVFNPEPDDPPRRREEDEDEDEEKRKARNKLPRIKPLSQLSRDRAVPPRIKKLIIKEIQEATEALALADTRDEIAEIELDRQKIMLSAAVGRFKVSKRHSIKEYCV